MAQELPDQFLEAPDNPIPSSAQLMDHTQSSDSAEPSLSRSLSASSRLNAQAPEFVPRTNNHQGQNHHQQQQQQQRHHHHHRHPHHHQQQHHPHHHQQPPRMVPIHPHGPPPPPPPMIHVFHPHSGPNFHAPVVVPNPGSFDYYGSGGFAEHEHGQAEAAHSPEPAGGEGLTDEVINKVTKQVEYYFSDLNLATTEHLMKFISKDPEGFVPITVLSPFKKIRALVNNNAHLAAALRTSTKLVVSEDGKKVRRQHPITESYLEELQSRIVVAENLPEDHCYQNLVKVFSVVGGVKTIRTCYPQNANGSTPTNPRSGKGETFLFNKLHAFVEYETAEQADRAVSELNDERNWRSGLRVRFLPKIMRHGQGRGRKNGHEGDGNVEDEDLSMPNFPEHIDDQFPAAETSNELTGEDGPHDREGVGRRGKGRGRGGRGRGRGQYNNNNRNAPHPVGTPPAGQPPLSEQCAPKPPPGPRMPDGTRGFTMGRGKSVGLPLQFH